MKGPKQSYASMMDAVLEKREASAKRGSPIRPSNAGSCARRIAYEYQDFVDGTDFMKEKKKSSVLRLLNLGHYVEEQAISELRGIEQLSVRFGQQLVEFFSLENGHVVEGSTDAVMWSDEVRCILDVKSVGDRWHNYRASKWDGMLHFYSKMQSCQQFEPNAFWVPNLEAFLAELGTEDSLYKNLIQVNGYGCTKFLQDRGVDHGVILRYNKNNSTLMEIRFALSPALFDQMKDKFNGVVKAIDTGDYSTAPKERVLGSIDCAYCPAKEKCWPKAGKRDFFSGPGKQWATKSRELEKGSELEDLMAAREVAEKGAKDLAQLDTEIILLLEGHETSKVKLENGDVFEIKYLKSGAELRRSKE